MKLRVAVRRPLSVRRQRARPRAVVAGCRAAAHEPLFVCRQRLWALLVLLLWAPAAPAEERTQSAEQLIEQVMQQRALKALLTEELEVLRLRAELRRLRGETAAPSAPDPNSPQPAPTSLRLPQVVALWEDGDGRVASVSAPAAEGEVRRLRILREGEEIAIGGRKFRVHRISPEGVRVRIGDAKDETLLPY